MRCRKGCPRGQVIRPGKCQCVPRRSCQITQCKPNTFLNSKKCGCFPVVSPPSKPPAPPALPAPPLPPSGSCHIATCDYRYRLNKQKCKCQIKRGIMCRKGCRPGFRIYPGKCKCIKIPFCLISSCVKGFRLSGNKCVVQISRPWVFSRSLSENKQWSY